MQNDKKAKGSFDSLSRSHELFRFLADGRPYWWTLLTGDKALRIDIRKDNYINVYFEDSCALKIEMAKSGRLIMTTHASFTTGIEGKQTGKWYFDVAESLIDSPESVIRYLKENITRFYGNGNPMALEETSEKYVQWAWSTLWNNDILDTEFAYNLDEPIPDLRIDMVQNSFGTLRFIELKRINDNRLRVKDPESMPEIITQMHKYAEFISIHKEELLTYYQAVYDIKRDLGIRTSQYRPTALESKPHLAIANLYSKIESRRKERIEDICRLLKSDSAFTWEMFSPLHRIREKMSDTFYRDQKVDQFVRKKDMENLCPAIADDAKRYFAEHGIAWWSTDGNEHEPTWHKLSSQIHCLNHLFTLRKNHDAVLAIIRNVRPDIRFNRVLPVPIDGDDIGYICFEFTFKNRDLGLDRHQTRGKNCTSVDALIYAEDSAGKRWLIPIEWKYTETYDGREGWYESIERYNEASNRSNINWSVLHRADPYYELARQEILMEKIIMAKDRSLPADEFLHLFVAPKGTPLWNAVEKNFIPTLINKEKFVMIDNHDFIQPARENAPDVISYISSRYAHSKE